MRVSEQLRKVSVSKERESRAAVPKGRWTAKRKIAAALRLLRSEDLETLPLELGVTAAMSCDWPVERRI